MKITKKEGILLGLISFVIIAAVYTVYFLLPTLEEIGNAQASIEQKEIQIASMQAQINQISNMQEQIATMKAEIAEDTKDIPRGVSQPLQLVEITNIINEYEGQTLVISFDTGAVGYSTYQKNTASLNFSTTYENLLNILNAFDILMMENQIVSMDVTNSQDDSDFFSQNLAGNYLNITFTIEFFSFYLDPNDPESGVIDTQSFEQPLPADGKNPFFP